MLWQFAALLAVHWFGDFVLQTHWQATNKSKNWNALFRHVFTYTVVLFFATPFIFPQGVYWGWFLFVTINGSLHFVTDAVTSRITSKLYAKGDIHNFFVAVGFDQLIHQFTLAATIVWINSLPVNA